MQNGNESINKTNDDNANAGKKIVSREYLYTQQNPDKQNIIFTTQPTYEEYISGMAAAGNLKNNENSNIENKPIIIQRPPTYDEFKENIIKAGTTAKLKTDTTVFSSDDEKYLNALNSDPTTKDTKKVEIEEIQPGVMVAHGNISSGYTKSEYKANDSIKMQAYNIYQKQNPVTEKDNLEYLKSQIEPNISKVNRVKPFVKDVVDPNGILSTVTAKSANEYIDYDEVLRKCKAILERAYREIEKINTSIGNVKIGVDILRFDHQSLDGEKESLRNKINTIPRTKILPKLQEIALATYNEYAKMQVKLNREAELRYERRKNGQV